MPGDGCKNAAMKTKVFAVIAGLAVGIATGEWAGTVFLVGVGVVQVALTASTRFSAPLGA